jgi:hypothetical protein
MALHLGVTYGYPLPIGFFLHPKFLWYHALKNLWWFVEYYPTAGEPFALGFLVSVAVFLVALFAHRRPPQHAQGEKE